MSIATVLALAGCAASEDSDAARERLCERLRDHLVGLRLVGANVDLEAHRAAIKQALGHKFIDTARAVSRLIRSTARSQHPTLHAHANALDPPLNELSM